MELVGRRSERESLERALERAVAEFRTIALARNAIVIGSSVTEVESSIGWSGTATLVRSVDRNLLDGVNAVQLGILDALAGPATASNRCR